jgi:hypothetical protein
VGVTFPLEADGAAVLHAGLVPQVLRAVAGVGGAEGKADAGLDAPVAQLARVQLLRRRVEQRDGGPGLARR